jgi:Mg2+-importing ATPase
MSTHTERLADISEGAAGDSFVSAAYWSYPVDRVLQGLGAAPEGLSSADAYARLRRSGALAPHRRRTELVLLLRQFSNPITLLLVFATLVSAVLGEATDAAIILAIVLLSGLLSFWQEYRASRAVEELLASVHVTVEVWRDGARTFVPSAEIVPGDVVVLGTGDLIPGDSLLVEADQLLVDEAPLTGESYPVEKAPGVIDVAVPVARRGNVLFLGTHVVRGSATAVVVCTGADTELGRIARELDRRPPATRFERGLTEFGRLLLWVMVVITGLILVANVLLARPIVESFLFSVALAVGLTPQLLPAIVSISLSLGARRMARAKVVVKRLSAIEDLGGMDVLCTDKTGTLTQGQVRLAGALDIDGRPSRRALEDAYLNAFHHTGFPNPIDDAIIAAEHIDVSSTRRLGELPYDFLRRRLSVHVAQDGGSALITKGAVEDVLLACDRAERADGSVLPLAGAGSAVQARFAALSAQGYRVLGLARKALDVDHKLVADDEAELAFVGFLTFLDPPKPGIARTLRELEALGITLRMVTGDNRLVAAHIARSVGLDCHQVMSGRDIENIDDAELARVATDATVFAEIDPLQKERLVRAIRRSGRDVGFLGDGINDAPALHAADVGISVDTAADVARDAASVVLLEKNLEVLMDGVRLGRQTFANTLKYVFVTTSANFGNMASMAGATLLLPFLPLLPLQILLINFLTDLPATTIATDAVDPEQVRRPGVWDIGLIRSFMVMFGLISSVFDFLTFGVLRLLFHASPETFRSGWFLESVATELIVMLILRTYRPFFRSRPSTPLLTASCLVALVALAIPYTPLAGPLGFEALPVPLLVGLAAITTAYVVVTELAKQRFHRRA